MKNDISLGGLALVAALLVIAFPVQAQEAEVSYKADIHPILHDYCLSCHQPGGKGYEASGLDMTTYKSLMKGTKFGSVIKPGDSFTSVLIQLVEGRAHASIKMPLGMEGGLSKKNINLLKKWVDQGAKEN